MTDIQQAGMQMAIDALAAVAPMVITLAVGMAFVRIVLKFITGRV